MAMGTDRKWKEVVIDENCEFNDFYATGSVLQESFGVLFSGKYNGFDEAYWDFAYKGARLTFHYNIYLGMSIYPEALGEATASDNEAAAEIGELLLEKLQSLGALPSGGGG